MCMLLYKPFCGDNKWILSIPEHVESLENPELRILNVQQEFHPITVCLNDSFCMSG